MQHAVKTCATFPGGAAANFNPRAKIKSRNAGSDYPYPWTAHHIIPEKSFTMKDDRKRRIIKKKQLAVLRRSDYDLNDGHNIIPLPTLSWGCPVHSLLQHPSDHREYRTKVARQMKDIADQLDQVAGQDLPRQPGPQGDPAGAPGKADHRARRREARAVRLQVPGEEVRVRPALLGEDMDYWVLNVPFADGGIIDCLPDHAPPGWKLKIGESVAASFPKKVALKFSREYPDGRKLYDFQPNILRLLIVSPRARAVFEDAGVDKVEYLPVEVKDHKSKVVGKDYAILNPLGSVDAIDMAKSDVTMNAIIETQILSVEAMVLNRRAIPREAKMFRCKTFLILILVRDDLKSALEKSGVTGVRFLPAEGFDSVDY